MESLKRARARLRAYPRLLVACGPEATAYGHCVALKEGDVQRKDCEKEFAVFRQCLQDAAKRQGTRY